MDRREDDVYAMDLLESAPWQALRDAATIVLEACWCRINGHRSNKESSRGAGRALRWPRESMAVAAQTNSWCPIGAG